MFLEAKNKVRVLITGAAGRVSYALIFRIASGEMFGPFTEIELHLCDVDRVLSVLESIVKELEDCAFPLLKYVHITSNIRMAVNGIHWAFLVGAVPRSINMNRIDLLKVNGVIFMEYAKIINSYADSSVRVVVVGNPSNTNCLICMNNACDIPSDRFYALMSLDELRAKAQLAKKAGVNVSEISRVIIWGNHSNTQYPDFHYVRISGKPIMEVINDKQWLRKKFIKLVQKRGMDIIKLCGFSSAASAANAIIYSVSFLTNSSFLRKDDFFSIALRSNGEYDVDDGLIFSFPCFYDKKKLCIVDGLKFNKFSKIYFKNTLNELREEKKMAKYFRFIV
ncbi:malate dehydrogenase [Candidatus Legionella polyplacis]|uniref:Malate dehydrogenase n=1 Tax=Candidatus Legionella polyplacis TaxID=2005262 RepID=A0ABZ2GXT4_9GAMM